MPEIDDDLLRDELLLARLREVAAEMDPVPDLVLEAAMAAFTLHRLDAELVELISDSLDQPAGAVAVRAPRGAEVRMLSFQSGSLRLELQVTADGAHREIVAQVDGAEVTGAQLETSGEIRDLTSADGIIVAGRVPEGPVRLRLHTPRATGAFVTSWVLV